MRPYERYSLAAAAGLSIALHASAVVYFAGQGRLHSPAQTLPAGATEIRLTLTRPALERAAPTPAQAPPQAARAAVPLPVLQSVPASTQVVRPAPSRRPVPATEVMLHPASVAAALPPAAAADTSGRQPLPAAPNAAREDYLQQLLAHIESHKFYPRSARRRGQEGEISVSFMLQADGSIRALQVEGGSRALRAAAQRAVLSAQPVPAPPAALEFPERISFDMVFRLG